MAGVGVNNEFLDGWTIVTKICILCAFAASVRRNLYGKRKKEQLGGGTVSSTIANVCSAFWQNFWRDPSLDKTGKKALLLQRQLKKYIAEDPETKHQMALPLVVFLLIQRTQQQGRLRATAQLIVAALFFGLRSCEYSEVTGKRMTKKLTIGDVRFFQGTREVPKTARYINLLQYSTSVTITFVLQKNGQKYATITQHASGHEVCPVKAWAAIVTRILDYKGTNSSTEVDTVVDSNGERSHIKADEIARHLKKVVTSVGKARLGFDEMRVSTHSIRTSFAMMLYLQHIHPLTIMLMGRWSSDAFLLYIRPQVQQFSSGLSAKMVENDFFTVPMVDDGPATRNGEQSFQLARTHERYRARFSAEN